jgi:hypothetical protein
MDSEEREKVLFTVSPEVIQAARRKLQGCERCSKDAEVPLKVLLDELMRSVEHILITFSRTL